jgi:hypothetical protein
MSQADLSSVLVVQRLIVQLISFAEADFITRDIAHPCQGTLGGVSAQA